MNLGSARSQGQRQSTRLRGVMDDVLSVRHRRSHAVQGQPCNQNQRYRGQQGNELSERRCRRALQDNGPSILSDIRFGNSPILVSDEEKKRTRHDEPELPAFCIAHEFLRQFVGLEARRSHHCLGFCGADANAANGSQGNLESCPLSSTNELG